MAKRKIALKWRRSLKLQGLTTVRGDRLVPIKENFAAQDISLSITVWCIPVTKGHLFDRGFYCYDEKRWYMTGDVMHPKSREVYWYKRKQMRLLRRVKK